MHCFVFKKVNQEKIYFSLQNFTAKLVSTPFHSKQLPKKYSALCQSYQRAG
jgi:hypothetical protein